MLSLGNDSRIIHYVNVMQFAAAVVQTPIFMLCA